MLNQPNKDIIRAFANLESDYNFNVILKWFEDNLQQMEADSDYSEHPLVFRYQGVKIVLREFIKQAKTAKEKVFK